jgi:hypothetical protein
MGQARSPVWPNTRNLVEVYLQYNVFYRYSSGETAICCVFPIAMQLEICFLTEFIIILDYFISFFNLLFSSCEKNKNISTSRSPHAMARAADDNDQRIRAP